MAVIRTRSYLSDDRLLKEKGINRTEVFFAYAAGTDDGMGIQLLIAADLFSPSHSNDRDNWMLVMACPVCTMRWCLEDSIVGGVLMEHKVLDFKRLGALDPWVIQQVQTRCSLNIDRGPGSSHEFDVAKEALTFDGERYEGLLTVSPSMACSYCPEANDGRQFAVTFPRPGLAIQSPSMKLWPLKREDYVQFANANMEAG